jgi:hypothetical protein
MIKEIEIQASSLKGFPSHDKILRKVQLYIPPKIPKACGVIFVLSGWGERSSKYLRNDSAFGESLEEQIDQMIAEKKMPPSIIVFPDATSRLGFSQYINSSSLGNYQTYLYHDLLETIETLYPIKKEAPCRGIMGHSSGGFGALWMGFLKSDIFGHVTASAADSFFEISILPSIPHVIAEIESAGGVEAFIKKFLQHPNPSGQSHSKFLTMMTLSLAPCYAPNPAVPWLLGDLFFDIETGEIKESIWKKWLAFDPLRAIDEHFFSFKKLKSIVLECGQQDEYGLQLGHRQLSKKLKNHQIDHEFFEFPGRHSGHSWRFAERIQKMASRFNLN